MNYVMFDLETNGINVLNNSIMQMTIIATDGKILLNQYVYPYDGIIDAVQVHKIDEKKLKENNALQLYELCCLIKKVIRENYGRNNITWVAYNNFGFDQIVFERSFKLINNRIPENWYFMDLLPLIRNKYPNMKPNYKLATVYKNLINSKEEEEINFHSSLDDTMCLLEIFIKCLNYEKEFENYIRNQLISLEIFKNKLIKLPYYNKYMNFEFHNIKNIGDLYNKFKVNNYDINLLKNYLKEELEVRNGFYVNNIVSQINYIYELNK